jgi:hypothetical protein
MQDALARRRILVGVDGRESREKLRAAFLEHLRQNRVAALKVLIHRLLAAAAAVSGEVKSGAARTSSVVADPGSGCVTRRGSDPTSHAANARPL